MEREREEIVLPPFRAVGRQLEFPAVREPRPSPTTRTQLLPSPRSALGSLYLRAYSAQRTITSQYQSATLKRYALPSFIARRFQSNAASHTSPEVPSRIAITMSDLFSVEGKIVLVTGGAKGVGWGASRRPIACFS